MALSMVSSCIPAVSAAAVTSDVYDANDYEQTLSSCGYVRTDELVQGEGKILNSDVSDVWTKSSDGGDKTWLVDKYTVNDSLFIELRHSGVNGDTDHLVVYGIGSRSDIFGILDALTQNTGSNYISDAAMILRTYAENQAK